MQNIILDGGEAEEDIVRIEEPEQATAKRLEALSGGINPSDIAENALKSIQSNPELSNNVVIRILQDAIRALQAIGGRATGSRRGEALANEGRLLGRVGIREDTRNRLVALGRGVQPRLLGASVGLPDGPEGFPDLRGGPPPSPERVGSPDLPMTEDLQGNRLVVNNENNASLKMTFDARLAGGWRPVAIQGFGLNGDSRFNSIWERRPHLFPFHYEFDMPQGRFEQLDDEFTARGFSKTMHSTWIAGGEIRHWVMWEQVPNGPIRRVPGPELTGGRLPPGIQVASPLPPGFGGYRPGGPGSLPPGPFPGPVVRGGPPPPGFRGGPSSGPGIGFAGNRPPPGFVGGPGVTPSGLDRTPRRFS